MPTDLYNRCSGGVDNRALGFKFLVLAMMAMVSWGRKDQRHRQGPVSRSEVLGSMRAMWQTGQGLGRLCSGPGNGTAGSAPVRQAEMCSWRGSWSHSGPASQRLGQRAQLRVHEQERPRPGSDTRGLVLLIMIHKC